MPNIFHTPGATESLWDTILYSTSAAFIEVLVLVALGFLVLGLINHYSKNSINKAIQSSGKFQPLLGAFLGMVPGSAGTIFLVPFFTKRQISLGTIVAAFITTMGEAAIVFLAISPMAYLWVALMSFATGVITGYIVDLTSIESKYFPKGIIDDKDVPSMVVNKLHEKREPIWFSNLDKKIAPAFMSLSLLFLFPLTIISYSFPEESWNEAMHSFMDASYLIVFGMMILFVGYYIFRSLYRKHFVKWDDKTHVHKGAVSISHMLHDVFLNILYISVWVWYGITTIDLLIWGIGEQNLFWFLTLGGGIITLLLSLGAGIIPGCAPQIIFVNMFAAGLVPGSAMIANSIVQDGDAGFPILAANKKFYFIIKIINLIPGILVGSTFLILENFTNFEIFN